MPIYAYRCEACGFAQDVLQKISEDTLTICPSCGQDAYRKQVTAAGFQLKGSGWYVTDFRNGGSAGKTAPSSESSGAKDGNTGDSAAAPASTTTAAAGGTGTGTASAAPAAPAAAPAASSGTKPAA